MKDIIVGIDIGTGSAKAIAFDIRNTTVLSTTNESYPTLYDGDHHEQDPAVIYKAFKKAFKTLHSKLPPHKLSAIVFSSALHSLIAVDKAGKPVTNCIIWSDKRSNKQAQDIKADPLSDQIYYETGTPIHAMSPLCKIAYIKREQPDLFEKACKFISIKAYILHQLGYEFLIDHSLASATGLFDIEKLQWHTSALEVAGITSSHLSHPVPVSHQLKVIGNEQTRDLGIKEGTTVIIGGGDGPMANLGSLAINKKRACLTLGTSGAFRITSERVLKDPAKRIFNYIIHDHLYAVGGAVNNGGIVLRWLQNLFTGSGKDGMDFKEIPDTVSEIKPGSEGLIFLPWILGERAPVWETDAKGIYYGISFHHQQAHFIRSGLEGICFNLLNMANVMQQLSGEISEINFNGGLSRSEFFCQMISDIFNMEVKVIPEADLSTFGAIVLALKTLGYIENFDYAPKLNGPSTTYYPNTGHHKTYSRNFHKFMALLDFMTTENSR